MLDAPIGGRSSSMSTVTRAWSGAGSVPFVFHRSGKEDALGEEITAGEKRAFEEALKEHRKGRSDPVITVSMRFLLAKCKAYYVAFSSSKNSCLQ
jgi:hypothetical protein